MSFSSYATYLRAVALTGSLLMGCSVEERTAPPLYAMELREDYGEELTRSVAVKLEMAQGEGETLAVSSLKLQVTPTPPYSLNKLESQLGEAVLRTGDGQDWPEPVLRPVPQAVPILTRIQTAMALLKPGDRQLNRAIANVFESPPSVGFTQLETRGDAISMSTVALTALDGNALMAFAAMTGKRTSEEKPSREAFTLEGNRWILGESVELLRITGSIQASAAQPRDEEKAGE